MGTTETSSLAARKGPQKMFTGLIEVLSVGVGMWLLMTP